MVSQCVQVKPPTTNCKSLVMVPTHYRCSFMPLIPIILINIYDGYVQPSYVTAAQKIFVCGFVCGNKRYLFVDCGKWGWNRMAAALNSQLDKKQLIS